MNDRQDKQSDALEDHSDAQQSVEQTLMVVDATDSTQTDEAVEIGLAKRVTETALLCATSPLPIAELRKLFEEESQSSNA